MSFFWSQWGGNFYTEEWVRHLVQSWKVDVVRAALAVEPQGYLQYPDAELRKICTVVDAAIRNDVYVIVDWHGHSPHTDKAVEFFGDLARRYAGVPHLIWETWNEPLPHHGWPSVIKPHHAAILDRIRSEANDNLVICGTGAHCQRVDVAAADPLDTPNVAYGLHFYAGSHRQGLRDRVEKALNFGACVFASEYGLGELTGDGVIDHAEFERWTSFLNRNGISHLNWSMFDKEESCAALRKRRFALPGFSHRRSLSGQIVRAYLRRSRRREWLPAQA